MQGFRISPILTALIVSWEQPPGGIQEGKTFLTPVPNATDVYRIRAPTGRWKDGVCDCCVHGFFHPHVWCTFFCSKIMMAQVMTRMHLTWLGEPGPLAATQNTFRVVVILLISYIVYSSTLELASLDYQQQEVPTYMVVMKLVGSMLWVIWTTYSLCRTRQSIREQYSIPEQRCHGCEDLCCSFFCTCCSLAQMARHTGEYETYPGKICTDTGLPVDAPFTV